MHLLCSRSWFRILHFVSAEKEDEISLVWSRIWTCYLPVFRLTGLGSNLWATTTDKSSLAASRSVNNQLEVVGRFDEAARLQSWLQRICPDVIVETRANYNFSRHSYQKSLWRHNDAAKLAKPNNKKPFCCLNLHRQVLCHCQIKRKL